MCKYVEDFKNVFGENNNKYKISKLGGLKGSSISKEYDSLIELFIEGFYDRFCFIPSIKSYLDEFYNCKNIEEYLSKKYGKNILPQLEKECGKIDPDSIYVLIDTGIDCSVKYEQFTGDIFETIHKLLLANSSHTKYSTDMYTIETV